MGIQLFDWVENIVGKGEIACYEQFLLFPQCFLKLSVVDASNWVSMLFRVKDPRDPARAGFEPTQTTEWQLWEVGILVYQTKV